MCSSHTFDSSLPLPVQALHFSTSVLSFADISLNILCPSGGSVALTQNIFSPGTCHQLLTLDCYPLQSSSTLLLVFVLKQEGQTRVKIRWARSSPPPLRFSSGYILNGYMRSYRYLGFPLHTESLKHLLAGPSQKKSCRSLPSAGD
jgi:hypothetical protein